MDYPRLVIDKAIIGSNVRETVARCSQAGISVCGVIKGCSGLPEIARLMLENGCTQIGTSRISQIIQCIKAGVEAEYLLLRIPAVSELPELVRFCDISLQSEWTTLALLEQECRRQGKEHKVIVMVELGDLREGIWSENELMEVCVGIEQELPHIKLLGIGVNLGCYGSIRPTAEKMRELVALSEKVETRIGRKLELISGGATTSYSLVHWGTMPKGINHLRIGDNLLLSRGLQTNWGIRDMDYLQMTGFKIEAEVIEIKEKPSYPQGEFAFNAYGKLPHYEDRGIRKRALLALGNADAGNVTEMVPILPGIDIVGGSSDHTIIDITACREEIRIGDVLAFYPRYINLLALSSADDVKKIYMDTGVSAKSEAEEPFPHG